MKLAKRSAARPREAGRQATSECQYSLSLERDRGGDENSEGLAGRQHPDAAVCSS